MSAFVRCLLAGSSLFALGGMAACGACRPSSSPPIDVSAPALPGSFAPRSASSAALAPLSSTAEVPDAGRTSSRVRRPPSAPRPGWPLPMDCSQERCTTALGESGFRCKPGEKCFNPCPKGLAPNGDGFFCERICRADAECDEGRCVHGLCNSMGDPPCGAPPGIGGCLMFDGRAGFRCVEGGACYPWCKAGLNLYGGTHCVKACRTNAECPGGECSEKSPEGVGLCSPICPSEGCPYPWE